MSTEQKLRSYAGADYDNLKKYVILARKLELGRTLGSGKFGSVLKATWQNQQVAVKAVKGNNSNLRRENFG